MPKLHTLDANAVHYHWDNAIAPRVEIEPGDTVVFETRDSADGVYTRTSTHADVLPRRRAPGLPLTGPVAVRGAEPGDALAVEVVSVRPRSDFGWTAISPGDYGLLPREEFPDPFLQIWDLSDGAFARMDRRVAIPMAPFAGMMGTALDDPGAHDNLPPRKNGGNMDIKQLIAGSTLYLPVWVEGALFSVGDGHAAQGDGEYVTAIEMAAEVTLRFEVLQARRLPEPQFRTSGPIGVSTNSGPWYATTAQGPDLFANAQQAIRYMIEHLARERGFSREEAYIICSVAVDLRISEVADAPNWLVSALLPEVIFTA